MSAPNLEAFLSGTVSLTVTPRGGAPVTLLVITPGTPPASMTMAQWRVWATADRERMLREFENWANAFVFAAYEATQTPAVR